MIRLILVAPLLASAVLLSGCSPAQASSPPVAAQGAIAVRLAQVQTQALSRQVLSIGVVGNRREARLAFKIGGVVQQVLVDEGEVVRRGQLLARLDPREINAQVQLAQNGVDKARRDFERVQRLHQQEVASTQQLQDANTGLELTRAQLEVATFNQTHAVIRAPFDGRVVRRLVEPEEVVGPGNPVLMLSSSEGQQVVRVGLADRDVVALHDGDLATVRLEAMNLTVPARVSEIASAASAPAGTFEVELTLDLSAPRLPSGVIATVAIAPRTSSYRVIPAQSIVDGHGLQANVYTVDDHSDVARRVPIEVAFFSGGDVAVKSGLDQVAFVVTAGAGWLTPGAKVRVASGLPR